MDEMRTDGWNPIEWSVWAMMGAAKRLHGTAWHDVHLAYVHLGESLWWICQVDELMGDDATYERERDSSECAESILALRHVRNRFAHDGEIIGYVEPGPGPDEYGEPGRWEWQAVPASQRRGETEYQTLFVGREVESTMDPVVTFLTKESRALMDRRRGGTGPGVMVWTVRDETTGKVAVIGKPTYHPGYPLRLD